MFEMALNIKIGRQKYTFIVFFIISCMPGKMTTTELKPA
jgi:hypothetical protein